MEITKDILEAIILCQDLALKGAGNKILPQATLVHNFVNSAIQEINAKNEKKEEGGDLDG